jgi:protein ImuB
VFGALYAPEGTSSETLVAVAREFTPRLRTFGAARELVLDLAGLTRLFDSTREMAEQLRRSAADRGLRVRVAVAGTQTAARLLVRHRAGITVIEPGDEAAVLAPLSIATLADLYSHDPAGSNPPSPDGSGAAGDPNVVATLSRWGVRTLGALAALPAGELAARLGQRGVGWQRAARGEDPGPLVPSVQEERFEQGLDLEWPIEELEPLSFVLGRLLEPLSAHLERRDRGAAVLHVRLHLITREVYERSLQLPFPMREARTLRTLILLDLESHPPPAAIDRVVVAVDPTPGRIVQCSLLARPLPTVERVSTLMARLHALMGETRCGSPSTVDSWAPGAYAMKAFMPADLCTSVSPSSVEEQASDVIALALRRFRLPVVARVRVEEGRPVRVFTDRRELPGGRVDACAGPWRTSGGWWCVEVRRGYWDREEWDVTLADGGTYRIFRDRRDEKWFIEGQID